jgi:hypothetical protein
MFVIVISHSEEEQVTPTPQPTLMESTKHKWAKQANLEGLFNI